MIIHIEKRCFQRNYHYLVQIFIIVNKPGLDAVSRFYNNEFTFSIKKKIYFFFQIKISYP
jgi:hypothetical protein